jgi:16S rRNA processing protein RimM
VLLEVRGARREAIVVTAAPHGRGLVLVALEGVGDRTAAEALRGARVLVPATDLPPPAADEFYYHEMVGVRVETTDGRALGAIAETFSTGTNDVWVVRDGTHEHLIPVIADVVRKSTGGGRSSAPMPGFRSGGCCAG